MEKNRTKDKPRWLKNTFKGHFFCRYIDDSIRTPYYLACFALPVCNFRKTVLLAERKRERKRQAASVSPFMRSPLVSSLPLLPPAAGQCVVRKGSPVGAHSGVSVAVLDTDPHQLLC